MLAMKTFTCLIFVSAAMSVPIKFCINPHDGSMLQINEAYHDRCNVCTCQEGGQIKCTDRKCKRRRGMVIMADSSQIRKTRNTNKFEVDFVQKYL